MIAVHDVMVNFGGTPLFEEVTLRFLPGNCYGLIGANGAGKSTFLKVLSGELEPSAGTIDIPGDLRLSKLEQNHFKYDEFTALEAVLMGHRRLYEVHKERELLYAKADFSEEDGNRAALLEAEFAEMNGYECESEAGSLLSALGVDPAEHDTRMADLEGAQKVRVLLAQAMFGAPDILLLDEPTNHLDVHTIRWLEDYLMRLETLVIVVSHDRHFLNNVCTHIVDIDFRRVRIYSGNYDFWYKAAKLAQQQRQDQQKKDADKAKELKAFIERFSSNASKARQATSRKKLLENLTLEDLPTSTRKYPHIKFSPNRPCGKSVLEVRGLKKSIDGELVLDKVSFLVNRGDRIAIFGPDSRAKTTLFQILAGELTPDAGEVEWGSTITTAYFPMANESYFEGVELHLVEWLRQYASGQFEEQLRGFLGRMLFSGEDSSKPAKVLSGGERVRCMLSRMMLKGANVLLLDEPTNHLDLESITALNEGLASFDEVMLFSSHDRELVNTVANRLIEVSPNGILDYRMSFDDYVSDPQVAQARLKLYGREVPF